MTEETTTLSVPTDKQLKIFQDLCAAQEQVLKCKEELKGTAFQRLWKERSAAAKQAKKKKPAAVAKDKVKTGGVVKKKVAKVKKDK